MRHEVMHIGVVAERTGLSQRTLRHYDDIGLVSPSKRSDGGFRLYTDHDVQRLLLIRRMKPLDFSLQEMHELLTVTDAVSTPGATEETHQRLQEFVALAAARREDLTRKAAMADEFLERLRALSTDGEP
ncbi:MAG: MerR family transcriptional regulator [Pseudoxanthomonas suwonensis]|nr:MAG: MerR family transcriptional regulator [Pseudoxanthomonas suwonensis]